MRHPKISYQHDEEYVSVPIDNNTTYKEIIDWCVVNVVNSGGKFKHWRGEDDRMFFKFDKQEHEVEFKLRWF